ncbi:hypothetical protein B6U91_01420 [Candidatus Pacearchaeota archaeon ex4484_71]|nr:MAG: hypothetical protein B6U91_01420 [Candidatus Pacearchaeota archaeon ex4484_71]
MGNKKINSNEGDIPKKGFFWYCGIIILLSVFLIILLRGGYLSFLSVYPGDYYFENLLRGTFAILNFFICILALTNRSYIIEFDKYAELKGEQASHRWENFSLLGIALLSLVLLLVLLFI